MEGLLTNYYEYHFLYINGIHHVESRERPGHGPDEALLPSRHRHGPGHGRDDRLRQPRRGPSCRRARCRPFVMRFDTGSVPVGYLVLSSETKTHRRDPGPGAVQACGRCSPACRASRRRRPSAATARTVVVRRRSRPAAGVRHVARRRGRGPDAGQHDQPVGQCAHRRSIPHRAGQRDGPARSTSWEHSAAIRREPRGLPARRRRRCEDATDIPTGYALVNGRRAVYILVTKRADASTLAVVNEVKAALPQDAGGAARRHSRSASSSTSRPTSPAPSGAWRPRAVLGAVLTGLMVLVFLRDWRSVLVVVLNIPLALMAAVVGAVAHRPDDQPDDAGRPGAGRRHPGRRGDGRDREHPHADGAAPARSPGPCGGATRETAVPRLLAMLCILAVFIPSFFMQGAARALFVPLSLAVGFSMVASYLLSSTFVPVLSAWLLRHASHARSGSVDEPAWFERLRAAPTTPCSSASCAGAGLVVAGVSWPSAPRSIVWRRQAAGPGDLSHASTPGKFRLRLRAPDGTHIERTEQIALRRARASSSSEWGADNVDLTLGYVGMIPSSYPINAVYQWTRGPGGGDSVGRRSSTAAASTIEKLKERLRDESAPRRCRTCGSRSSRPTSSTR